VFPPASPTPLELIHPAQAWSGSGRLDAPARRIVSLLPSATEIVAALGIADRLVAVTHECDYPADAVQGVPRITTNLLPPEVSGSREIDAAVRSAVGRGHGLYALDGPLMAQLEPDLILTQELCDVCAVSYPTVLRAARTAGGAGGPLVVSLEPHTIADVLATIGLVARLAGVDARGERLAADLSDRLGRLPGSAGPDGPALALAHEPAPARPRVAVVEWLDPLFVPGHWVPEQVELAGGESVIGQAGERSRESSWEAVAAADPDVVVLGLCGFDLEHSLAEWVAFDAPEQLTRTRAWRDGQLWAIDGSAYVSRPGPRLVDGVEILAAILSGRADSRAVRLPV
jgi:iron complex transport system substrate-binding protein